MDQLVSIIADHKIKNMHTHVLVPCELKIDWIVSLKINKQIYDCISLDLVDVFNEVTRGQNW